mmetsp:Transcript_7328/g.21619  ORF Transcript_7328/g.21619 Transcript_7328/m.21619 type:complete len:121 (-) Transcript_7328:2008-2370(-)
MRCAWALCKHRIAQQPAPLQRQHLLRPRSNASLQFLEGAPNATHAPRGRSAATHAATDPTTTTRAATTSDTTDATAAATTANPTNAAAAATAPAAAASAEFASDGVHPGSNGCDCALRRR